MRVPRAWRNVNDANFAIVIATGVFLGIGLVSRKLIQSGITPPLIVTVAGVATGFGAQRFTTVPYHVQIDLILYATQLALAVALMGTALMLPPGDFFHRGRSLSIILSLGMVGMWLTSTVIIYGIIGVSAITALLAAATVTPTDPVLARTISEGALADRNIPNRIRSFLLEESQLNDGLAYPFVLLAASLLFDRNLLHYWAPHVVLWSVIGAAVLGAMIGFLFGYLVRVAQRHDLMVRRHYLNFTVFLAIFSVILGEALHMDGVLTVAVAGLAYRYMRSEEERQEAQAIQTEADLFFTLPVFFILGLVLPWRAWIDLGWKVVALAVAILVLRRIPVVLLIWRLLRPEIRSWQEALFVGWFGPIGISTLFYVVFAVQQTRSTVIWPIVTLVIVMSILAHGISAAPFTRALGRWEWRSGDDASKQLGAPLTQIDTQDEAA